MRTEHNVPAVAVFWIDAEDHDWDEGEVVRRPRCRAGAYRTVAVGDPAGAHAGPVARVHLDESIDAAIAELATLLPQTEFSAPMFDAIRAAYHAGAGMADAFGRWMESVLGPRGLIVYDSSDPAAKPLVAGVFAREIERAGETSRLATKRARPWRRAATRRRSRRIRPPWRSSILTGSAMPST